MKQTFWNSKTFRLWIGCYFIVLLIPILFSCILYHNSAEKLTKKAYENTELYIRQVGGIIDEQLNSVFSISDAICLSNDIHKLRYINLPFTAEKYYAVHRYAKYLNTYVAYQQLVESAYIYCPQLECLIDSGHIYTRTNQYEQVIQQRLGLNETVFESIMRETDQKRLLMTDKHLLLLQAIPNDIYTDTDDLVLIIAINLDPIVSLLKQAGSLQEGRIKVVLPAEDVFGVPSDMFSSNEHNHFPPVSENITASNLSTVSSVKYVLSIPSAIVLKDVYDTASVFLYIIICTLVFGGIFAYLLTRHNYRPVHRLKETLNIEAENENEFILLIQQSEKLKKTNIEASEALKKLSNQENRWMIAAMLSGDLAALDESQISTLRSSLAQNEFVVAYCKIDDFDSKAKEEECFRILGDSFFVQCKDDAIQCMIQYHHSGLSVVFCLDREMDPYEAQLAVKQMAKASLATNPILQNVSIYIGEAHDSIEGISQSYTEALKAKEYSDFVSENSKSVLLYDKTMDTSIVSFDDFDVAKEEKRLVSMMIEDDYDSCEQLLSEILTYYTAHEGVSLHVMRVRMFGIMRLMLNTLQEVKPLIGDSFMIDEKLMTRLMTARTMQELEDAICEIFSALRTRNGHNEVQLEERLERVIAYIHAQFTDPNLSVQQLADKFDMSLPFLSREFKKKKGIGLLSYINGYRIEKAKAILLLNDNITLPNLAAQVGYTSSQTLIRIFKRYAGMTPGQYRMANGKKNIS